MRTWHWIGLVGCGVMTAVTAWQVQQLRWARAAVPSAEPTMPAVATAEPTELVELREQTRDLARLRNEVRQLRAQRADLETARRDHATLVAAQTRGVSPMTEPPPGFVSKEKLTNVGYATPEDAVQTFFWAMREGNVLAAIQSLSPNSRERQRIDRMSPEDRAHLEREFQGKGREDALARLTDVGVRSRETVSDDVMVLHVGSSVGTNTMPIRLERTAEGWKLHDPL